MSSHCHLRTRAPCACGSGVSDWPDAMLTVGLVGTVRHADHVGRNVRRTGLVCPADRTPTTISARPARWYAKPTRSSGPSPTTTTTPCGRPPTFARPGGRFGPTRNDVASTRVSPWTGRAVCSLAVLEASTAHPSSQRTLSPQPTRQFACGTLRRAFQRDDRQVPRPTMEVDLECAPIAGLSRDERARSGTG